MIRHQHIFMVDAIRMKQTDKYFQIFPYMDTARLPNEAF